MVLQTIEAVASCQSEAGASWKRKAGASRKSKAVALWTNRSINPSLGYSSLAFLCACCAGSASTAPLSKLRTKTLWFMGLS